MTLTGCVWFIYFLTFPASDSLICSHEGLAGETSAPESLHGGQFTLSTQLTKPKFHVSLPHRNSTSVSLKTRPSSKKKRQKYALPESFKSFVIMGYKLSFTSSSSVGIGLIQVSENIKYKAAFTMTIIDAILA